ncbi:unnamed protein product [Strongylus vulgaris]|uniref:Endonuclease/exonuclease/phosphatase domain-containing protein n=1 Tax=Strongylus vulgaris TaxID=40348 RepID=A0A3P7J3G7_STRVU|nr:unnamed protein product [Strongylus vulgaris]
MVCTYNARTVSNNADLYAHLEAVGRINYHVIALQETKSRKTDFVAGDFNAKIGMSEEGEHRIGRSGSRLRNENGNRLGLLSAARLFHGNSIFMKKEHRRWTWELPNVVAQIGASFKQKCDSAGSWKRRFATMLVKERSRIWRRQIGELLITCDWLIEETQRKTTACFLED